MGTVRREVLDHLLIFGPRQLEGVLEEFIDHYHTSTLGQRDASRRTMVNGTSRQNARPTTVHGCRPLISPAPSNGAAARTLIRPPL